MTRETFENEKEIVENLENFRKTKHLSQKALAESLGFSRTFINNITLGKERVTYGLLDKVKEVYNVDLNNYQPTELTEVQTTQGERFKYIRTEILNLSSIKLAQMLHVVTSTILNIEGDRTDRIEPRILKFLSQEYLINIEWLLFGTGDITKVDTQERYEHQLTNENVIAIPFYNVKAAAGSGIEAPSYTDKDVLYFDRRWIRNVLGADPSNLSIIQCKGNSMDSGTNNPDDIKDGDLLLIDTSQKMGNNKTFVFREDNDLRVKKLKWELSGTLSIISNNPSFQTEILEPDMLALTNFEIIGKVIWNGSRENV